MNFWLWRIRACATSLVERQKLPDKALLVSGAVGGPTARSSDECWEVTNEKNWFRWTQIFIPWTYSSIDTERRDKGNILREMPCHSGTWQRQKHRQFWLKHFHFVSISVYCVVCSLTFLFIFSFIQLSTSKVIWLCTKPIEVRWLTKDKKSGIVGLYRKAGDTKSGF